MTVRNTQTNTQTIRKTNFLYGLCLKTGSYNFSLVAPLGRYILASPFFFIGKSSYNARHFSIATRMVNSIEVTNKLTSRNPSPNFVGSLLNSLNDPKNALINDEQSQKTIENIIFDEYESVFSNNTKNYIVGGINTEILNPILSKFLMEKEPIMQVYINNLFKQQAVLLNNNKKTDKLKEIFMAKIITSVQENFMLNLCYNHILLIYTFHHSENDKHYLSVPVSITIGKRMVSKYINNLKEQYIKENGTITYRLFLDKWKHENREFAWCIGDDNVYAPLGCKILEILTSSDIVSNVLMKSSNRDKQHRHYVLEIKDKHLMSKKTRHSVVNLPLKLPMICPPKPYQENALGGYLLNDDRFADELFIAKKAYALTSELAMDNKIIFNMINNISKTPYKINIPLLDYINNEGAKHNFLIDPRVKHKFADLENKTKYQQSQLASYNSKVILQETILGIANFYSKFSKIYFPLRLDQRGRLYCSPSYLNYQANELSKALLLFAEPGIIKRNNTTSINYLKCYGANCYGGTIAKASHKSKTEWVDNNLDNIINYDNGILLNKAKDRLLFLSFCMEYKRFYDFSTNENIMEFHTCLPVQLDATCNGFQHMALLSNEDTLFQELNLSSYIRVKSKAKAKAKAIAKDKVLSDISDIPPSDFYSFLLHKLVNFFKSKIDSGEEIDPKTKGSYLRLFNFLWKRTHIKKAIMTIPYNSSISSMKKYLVDGLDFYENIDKTNWYTSGENSKYKINDKDLYLLITCLKFIIDNDFQKIKKLTKYLINVATLLNLLELPIVWTLPTGLTIKQSYLETKSTSITPFMHSKVKLNLKVTIKDKYDSNKQVRALMPNLIHSLDGSSLSLLYEQFISAFDNKLVQFFPVHDCFGTTCDKVFILKTILASVYTDLYSSDPYLNKFDSYILDNIENNTDFKLDRDSRTVELPKGKYIIHDVDWVLNKKHLSVLATRKIDSQNILI